MPRSAALVFAVASLVAAAAFAYHVLDGGGSERTAEVEGTDAATLAALRDLRQRLDRVEHEVFQPRLAPTDPAARLAELEARLHALEDRSVAAPAATGTGERPPTTSTEGPPAAVDVRSLSDEDLLVKARTLGGRQSHDIAAPYWRELLARSPSDELFVEANLQLGYAHRGAKDHDQAEEAFREALRVAGPDSSQGQWATYQIAWEQRFRGENAAARDTMTEVANARATSRNTRGHARLYVARFSLELNDTDRAREALQAILREFGGSKAPGDVYLVQQANTLLEPLK